MKIEFTEEELIFLQKIVLEYTTRITTSAEAVTKILTKLVTDGETTQKTT